MPEKLSTKGPGPATPNTRRPTQAFSINGPPLDDELVELDEGFVQTARDSTGRISTIESFHRLCSLAVHDVSSSREDVLVRLDLFPHKKVFINDILRIAVAGGSIHEHVTEAKNVQPRVQDVTNIDQFHYDRARSFPVKVKASSRDISLQNEQIEISISAAIATAFRLSKGMKVMLSKVGEDESCASHVEIVFRDQYLARADMWRLVTSELMGRCLYRGQKLAFMDSIKATVKSVFIHGRKTHAALFGGSTKPIFRSESARYVLFIQMSREMWDFDSEGSGEIMFDKVINGFLPDLFKRWSQMQVRHLVSIVLFTRITYDNAGVDGFGDEQDRLASSDESPTAKFQDFYKVVVSDMASGESANILTQLKREFKVFLRDISIRVPQPGDFFPMGSGLFGANMNSPDFVIAGHPSDAAQGNILEAINLASSQFSSDYIDRDLWRTGVSIVVISPGTGLFEVDHDLLAATTDNLIDNGVGIDLVCLSRMPLHSVPLFKFERPSQMLVSSGELRPSSEPAIASHDSSTPQSFHTNSPSSFSPKSFHDSYRMRRHWSYGIPHWIDVSFWSSDEEQRSLTSRKKSSTKASAVDDKAPLKRFVPRVRMYEIQMMGIAESVSQGVMIPSLLLKSPRLSDWSSAIEKARSGSFDLGKDRDLSGTSMDIDRAHNRLGKSNFSTSPSSVQGKRLIMSESHSRSMDLYDEVLFQNPRIRGKQKMKVRNRSRHAKEALSNRSRLSSFQKSALSRETSAQSPEMMPQDVLAPDIRVIDTNEQVPQKANPNIQKGTQRSKPMPRSISFGLRGLAPSVKTVASAKVDNSQSSTWTTKRIDATSGFTSEGGSALLGVAKSDTIASNMLTSSDTESGQAQSSDSEHVNSSKPIPIGKSVPRRDAKAAKHGKRDGKIRDRVAVYDRVAVLKDVSSKDQVPESVSASDEDIQENTQKKVASFSPRASLAPWLTVLNPSNPSKTNAARTLSLGRWQHIFPRPPKTSQMKWKSLCSPAAVPLTTEEFPTADQLQEEFKESSYLIIVPEELGLSEQPRSLVQEILAFRLSRGFQIVVGVRVKDALALPLDQEFNSFNEDVLTEIESTVVLSRGTVIHQLSRIGTDRLRIRTFTRHNVKKLADVQEGDSLRRYSPRIRSMLADAYETQSISIMPQRGVFQWELIDAFIAGHERPQAAQYVENLRPWRARFVLIPVDLPASVRRMLRSSEDNDEEIRLDGIRKLSQLWQRFRFVPQDERRFQAASRKTKDSNPLDITYQTKDPSAIVAAELEAVLEGDETGRPVQLLPEPELYQRPNLNLRKLAETIQGDKGVRMLDRRWHLRLHYNCFIGMELTSWLLENFRDVTSREEAEQLGMELMKGGLFKHVEQRHDFRDGNYFYQIESDYRTPRPESRGWFGRSKSAVPSTPVTDQAPEPVKATRSRASSNADTASDTNSSVNIDKRPKPSVALSKSLLYDVDHRRRSYRPEVINLHYDRLHNPDNCYHIRIEWMNTTPRLIQEAVVSWATNAERYGLRLIEVPIGEASSITGMHPFRAPYRIKLALPPPNVRPQIFVESTSFGQQPKTDAIFYQRAIMKYFNFVLDYEAATAFPANVEVSYSWGKPDYRFPQYIHRTGVLIAQITDDGDFLLLANRLFNNRSMPVAATSQSLAGQRQNLSPGTTTDTSAPHRPTSNRSGVANLNQFPRPTSSPRNSPHQSPSIRATLDVPAHAPPALIPSMSNKSDSSTKPTATHKALNPAISSSSSPSTNPIPILTSPEELTASFRSFCNDPNRLETFYTDILNKSSTPTPTTATTSSGTPVLGSVGAVGGSASSSSTNASAMPPSGEKKTPLRTPLREVVTSGVGEGGEEAAKGEAGIPQLDLGGKLLDD